MKTTLSLIGIIIVLIIINFLFPKKNHISIDPIRYEVYIDKYKS